MDNHKDMANKNLTNKAWLEVIPVLSDIWMKYSREEQLWDVEIDRLFDKIKKAHEEDIKNDTTMTSTQKETAQRNLSLTKNILNHIAKEILKNNHRLIETEVQ